MASLTRWTWVWVNSGSWWWTGRPGVLQFMGSDTTEQLIWSDDYLEKLLNLLFEVFFTLKDCCPNSDWKHICMLIAFTDAWRKLDFNSSVNTILTTFKLQLAISVQIALRDEIKLNVRGSVSFRKLIRSRTLTLRRTNASLIFPSKYGQ